MKFNKELLNIKMLVNNHAPRDVSKIIGVTYATFNLWQNGHVDPKIESVIALGKFFKIDYEDFIKRVDSDKYNKYLRRKYYKKYVEGK